MSASRLLAGATVLLLLACKPLPSAATITFTETPQDVLVAVGSPASFTCQFSSSNSASVQWQKDGVSLTPSSRISFNSTSLSVNPTMTGDDGMYSCVVTDQVDDVSHTRSANLTFAYILDSFLISPESTDSIAGTAVSLFCLHSGSLPAAQMSWVKDGTTLSSSGTITITTVVLTHANPPQTSSSISISPVTMGDGGQYECVATNSLLPGSPVRSSMATLTVSAELAAPVITEGPSSMILLSAGSTATLECSTTGVPTPTVSWQFEGASIDTSLSKISVSSSGGNSTLTITNFQNSDVGNYRCIASNSQGTNTSSNATVEIAYIEQSFQSPPSNTYTLLGQNGIIDCTPPRSIPPPMITWFRDSTLVSGSQFSIAANGSLLISGAMFSNEGDYVCVANNELLGITRSSSSAHFSVYVYPVISAVTQNFQLVQGQNFTLSCNASGTPMPNITWYKGNSLISDNNPSHLRLFGYSLTVFNAQVIDEGVYTCNVSNPAGSVQENISIDVIPFPVSLIGHTDIAVTVNSPVLIPCYLLEDPSINITWTFNGVQLTLPFPGFQLLSNGSLLVQTVSHSQEGLYTCTGTNSLGDAVASVQLEVQVGPSVTVSQSSLIYTQGQTVELVCTVTGDPTPAVQWYYNGAVEVPNALTPNAQLSSNDTILTLSPVLKTNEGVYTCMVSNSLGSVNATISLTVQVAPSISVSPISRTVLEGDVRTVEFSCSAPGDPQPTIKWLTSNMVDVLLLGNSRIQVLSDNTLRIINATVEDGDQYVCQGSNPAGTASATVTLTVYDEPAVSLLPYLNATQGSVIMLNCEVTGYPDPTVTWYKDSSLLATDDRVMVHNDSVVVINNAFSTDSGIYTCSAANVAGNSSASTELTVLVLPLIVVPNPIVAANVGSTARLVCNAMGDPPPQLTWYYGSVSIPNPSLPRYSIDANNSLVISNVMLSDEALMFVCQAVNEAGTESATVSLTVNIFPNITALYSSLTVIQGNSATLSCTISSGRPFPVITWYSNNTAIGRNQPGFQYVSNGQTLVIGSTMKSQEDTYTCRAVNAAGVNEDYIDLIVYVPPSFSPPLSTSVGTEGEVHVMECSVEGDPTPYVQWSQGGLVFPSGSSITFSPLSRENAGTYTCTAINIAGSVSQNVVLDVYYLPSITVPPSSTSVALATSGTFNCTATGNPEPQYHWLYNGQEIPGAEASTYTIPSVSRTDGGTYSCVATNAAGSDISNATLTIIIPPSAPTVTQVQATGSSSLSVTWSAPSSDGGSPVTSYIIEYRPTSSNDTYSQTNVPANALTGSISGLLPYKEYDVRMRAVNIAGASSASNVYSPAVRTHPGSPLPPNNLTFSFTPPSTVFVMWDPPTELNGELGVYEILITNWDNPSQETERVLFVETYVITGVSSSVTYRVQVRAGTIGFNGEVLWGPYVQVWILNGVEVSPPSMSTTLVSMTPTTSSVVATTSLVTMTTTVVPVATTSAPMTTTATIAASSTSEVSSSSAASSSVSESSTVAITPSSTMMSSSSSDLSQTVSVSSSSSILVIGSSTTTLLVGPSSSSSSLLAPSTTLAASSSSIATATSVSSSATPTPSPSPSPLPDPPSSIPLSLELSAPGIGSIAAQWTLPLVVGDFEGFHVYLSPPPPPSANLSLPITLDSLTFQVTISGLSNEVTYNVSVALYNEGGDGPAITETIQTSPGPPSEPVDVTVEVFAAFGEMQINWSPPLSFGGTLINYYVTVTNTNTGVVTSQTLSIPPLAQNFPFATFFTLLPDGVYQVTVTAENENGIGPPSDVIVVSLFANPPEVSSSSIIVTSSSFEVPGISSSMIETSSMVIMSSTVFGVTSTTAVTSSVVTSSSSVAPTSSTVMATSSTPIASPTPSVTLPDPPTVSPSGLNLLVPIFGQIIASWQVPQGDYNGFHVYISPPVSGLSLPISLSHDATVHIFNGLQNGVTYTVTIATYNEGGDGPSVSQAIQTLGGVPGPPTNIDVAVNPQGGYMQISWGPPDNPAGTLTEYRVYAQNIDTAAVVSEVVTVSPSSQNADFNVLLFVSAHEFSVTLQAVNQYGTGELSTPINVSLIISTSTSMSSTSIPVVTSSSPVMSSSVFVFTSFVSSSLMSSSLLESSSLAPLSSFPPSPSTSSPLVMISSTSSFSMEPSISPSIIEETPAGPTSNVAAIVVPIIVILLILVLVVIGVLILLYCYKSPAARRKMMSKLSPSKVEMSYELMPAPLPEKESPRHYVDTPLDKKPKPKPSPPTSSSKPDSPPPPPLPDLNKREAMEEPSSSDEEEDKESKKDRQSEKEEEPPVVLRKQQPLPQQQPQQQQPRPQGAQQQPRPQGAQQQPRPQGVPQQQQPRPQGAQQPVTLRKPPQQGQQRGPPLTKKEQEAMRKEQEKRQKELKKKQEKRQKELKKQQEQKRKELIKQQEKQKKQRQQMLQQKYKQQLLRQQQMRQQQQQRGHPQQQRIQQQRIQQQRQQLQQQRQQQEMARQRSQGPVPNSQLPKVIQDDETSQNRPVIQEQPKLEPVQNKEEREERKDETEGDRPSSSLLGDYSLLDQQFMDVEPVHVPLDTPLIPPTKTPPNEPSEGEGVTPRRPTFDPGEYSYAELDSIRAKKAAAREAKQREEQAGRGGGAIRGRGGAPMGRGGVPMGRGGVPMGRGGVPMGRGGVPMGRGGVPMGRGGVMVGRGGAVVGRGGVIMRSGNRGGLARGGARGGVIMRGRGAGPMMRKPQEPQKRRSFLSRLTSSEPKEDKRLSRTSHLSGRGLVYGDSFDSRRADDIY